MDAGQQAMERLVAKAEADPAFNARLIADPAGIPDGVAVAVVEERPGCRHLVPPAPPPEGAISEEALTGVAGGAAIPPGEPGGRKSTAKQEPRYFLP